MDLSPRLPESLPESLPVPPTLLPPVRPEEEHAHAGYGACSVSGCHCQAYQGQDYTCVNCGHNYSMHW